MSKVAVLDTNKNVLEPCHPAVARRLLKRGEAAVWQRYPFTIILKKSVPVDKRKTGEYTLSWDPGSKVSGLAITDANACIVLAGELHHRGGAIKKNLSTRSGFRRGRRTRNVRYRPARWANRARQVPVLTDEGWTYQRAETPEGADTSKTQNTFNRVSWAQLRDSRYRWERLPQTKTNCKQKKRWLRVRVEHQKRAKNGWIAPSLMTRVFNMETWTRRLCKVYPITELAIENVKFDMQLMEKPDVHGIEYQHGTLQGREIREYLLELTGRKCAYCGKGKRHLQVEHIIPKAKGGSDSPNNLTMACLPCNQKKGNLVGAELEREQGKAFAEKVKSAKRKSKKGLSDAAAVNTIRWKLVETLQATGLPVALGTGGKTAHHRICAGLPKTHYYDAASVACVPQQPTAKHLRVLVIGAIGYGTRDKIGRNAFCGRRPMRDKKKLVRGERGRRFNRKPGAPGFVKPITKISDCDGFRKFDQVTLTRKDGTQFHGVLNCFDKTDAGKPQQCRVTYLAPEKKNNRVVGHTAQLRRNRCRDGYRYGFVLPNRTFHQPKPLVPEPTPPSVKAKPTREPIPEIMGEQLELLSIESHTYTTPKPKRARRAKAQASQREDAVQEFFLDMQHMERDR